MKERFDYNAIQRLSFSLDVKDRVIATQDPTIYVIWEGASKEAVHGFVLRWGQRTIHFIADCGIKSSINPVTQKKEETINWTVTAIGTRSWRSEVRPYQFEDQEERRVACELAVGALTIFPGTYSHSIVTHTAAKLAESLQRALYGRTH